MEYNISIEISHIKNITERIDYIRRQNNLNQEQLAAQLHISQPAVSKYLKNRVPPADILLKLADLGSTTIEWILTGKKNHFYTAETLQVADPKSPYHIDSDIKLAQRIARLKPAARQVIKNLIDLVDNEG